MNHRPYAIQITKLASQDIPRLAHFARQTYREAYAHEMHPDHLTHHLTTQLTDACFAEMAVQDEFFVAKEVASKKDDWLGFVQIGPVTSSNNLYEPGDFAIRRLYVQRAFQETGIGTQLITHALGLPELRNAPRVTLMVWETNTRAQQLYQRFGFEKVAERAEFDHRGTRTGADHIMMKINHRSGNFT